METPDVSLKAQSTSDPLLQCLIILSKHYSRTSSVHGLTSGLPLDKDNHLTMDSFLRALQRVDLTAKEVKLPIQNIETDFLPMLLFLKGRPPCVLTEIRKDTVTVIFSDGTLQPETVDKATFAKEYVGKALAFAPGHHFDTRTEEGEKEKRRWFWEVMKRAWAIYGEIFIASLLINIFALASPLFIMNVYDRVVPNPGTSSTLWVLASGVIIVMLFDFLMRNLRAYFIDSAGKNIDIQLSKNIFEHLLDIKMGSRPNSVGTLANTVQAFEAFREFITSATVSVLVDVPFAIIFLIVIGILGGWIAIIPILAVPLILFFGVFVQKPLDAMIRKSYRYSAEKHAILVETLSSVEAIKGMRVEGHMQKLWENVLESASQLSVRLRTLATLGINFSMFIQQVAVVLLVIAGVFTIQNGHMSVGALVACTILTSRALVPISQVAGILARYQQSKTAIQALDTIMLLPTERPKDKKFLYLSKFSGDIEFRDVTFNYPDQPVSALSHISFHIKPNEKVGIIGTTGSGKSTIIKLIMKFYEPTKGNILIDGYEEHQLDPAELRYFIGYVPQDITLFHGTIKENIIFGASNVDDNAILTAANISTVDSFVAHHPEGFNRPVGERGQFLSGGQRQAIVIARALILDPSVLIVDELGNSMDDATIALLIDRFKKYLSNKTLILVTHKAILLNLVDRLIVLDNGRIVIDGPKDEVLKKLAERKVPTAAASTTK